MIGNKLRLMTFLLLLPIISRAEVIWFPMPQEAYKFGELYPEAQRLLFAFDYGHALVYERLLHFKGQISDPREFEGRLLTDIFAILRNPPATKVEEDEIAPLYVFNFPLSVDLFDWSHLLHQFVLDIMATSEDRGRVMFDRINEVFTQYKANRPVAITDVCKTMLFMDGHHFSKAFRRTYPSFNLLIWSYHWFQGRLYEALMQQTREARDREVDKAVQDFRILVSDLPDSAEFDMMPMMDEIAPSFAGAIPKMAAAFDNNHMLHDIVSDILASPRVNTITQIKREGLRTGRMALDSSAYQSNECLE